MMVFALKPKLATCYLKVLAGVFAAFLLATVVATAIFDPLGLSVVLGWRPFTPTPSERYLAALGRYPMAHGNREAKVLNSYPYQPSYAVLGSSNVWSHIDITHHQLTDPDRQYAYNFGLAGVSMFEIEHVFQHLLAVRKPERVIIGLEFFMFNGERPLAEQVTDYPMAHLPGVRQRLVWLMLTKVVSEENAAKVGKSLVKSIWDLLFSAAHANTTSNAGQTSQSPAERNQKMAEMLRDVDKSQIGALYRPDVSFAFTGADGRSTFDSLAHVLEIAQLQDVEVRLYLSPHNVRTYEVIRALGLWQEYRVWMKRLAEITSEVNAGEACEDIVPLLDFGTYKAENIESVFVPEGKQGFFPSYYDSFHFRVSVGNRLLDRLMSWRCGDVTSNEDWGTMLSVDNVDAYLQAVEQRRAEFAARHPDVVADVLEVVTKVRGGG